MWLYDVYMHVCGVYVNGFDGLEWLVYMCMYRDVNVYVCTSMSICVVAENRTALV